MKARITDQQVKVYSSMDENAVSIATLPQGSEIEYGAVKKKAGKTWIPITLSTGQKVYIPGETHLYVIRESTVLQDKVEVHAEPSGRSPVTQQLKRFSPIYILQVVKGEDQEWVHMRDRSGREGYISGNTMIRMAEPRSKARGRRNVVTAVTWIIAGLVLILTERPSSGDTVTMLFGYGAIIIGGGFLIMGIVQYFTAPA